MTKKANPKSCDGINIKSRSEDERRAISNFKSLANHLNVEISDLFFEQAEITLKKYNWPKTPQLQLSNFQKGGTTTIELCKCGKPIVVYALELKTKQEHKFCRACFSKVPLRYDAKVWNIKRRL